MNRRNLLNSLLAGLVAIFIKPVKGNATTLPKECWRSLPDTIEIVDDIGWSRDFYGAEKLGARMVLRGRNGTYVRLVNTEVDGTEWVETACLALWEQDLLLTVSKLQDMHGFVVEEVQFKDGSILSTMGAHL